MKIFLMCLVVTLLSGCAALFKPTGTTRVMEVADGIKVCAPITNVDQLMPVYVVQDTSKYKVGFEVPTEIPVGVDLEKDSKHSFYSLADTMNQDNIAIQAVLYTMVMLRNAAPCNETNIKMSWEAMNNVIDSLKSTYAPVKMIQAGKPTEDQE